VAFVTSTKVRALDAAVELVGTQGLRALTHARVDERAGLPKGSTSNYFRTRESLLLGVVEWIAELEVAAVGAAMVTPQSGAELVDLMCDLMEIWTRQNRVLTAARLTMFMEAAHHAGIRAVLALGRAAMEQSVTSMLARLGAPDPTTSAYALAACCEGVILHRIARHDDTDPRPLFELVVSAALPH
jgi:DNA-binding transcriptional regulator YbjK